MTTITDAELTRALDGLTSKMDILRHRVAAGEQLAASDAADLAAAIEELTADAYRLADRLHAAGHRTAVRTRVLADTTAEAATLIRQRQPRPAPEQS